MTTIDRIIEESSPTFSVTEFEGGRYTFGLSELPTDCYATWARGDKNITIHGSIVLDGSPWLVVWPIDAISSSALSAAMNAARIALFNEFSMRQEEGVAEPSNLPWAWWGIGE